jgi:hypothetical protein
LFCFCCCLNSWPNSSFETNKKKPRASEFLRDYDGSVIQMRMAYSAVAHLLVQWADCRLAGKLGLLKVMLYKVSSPLPCRARLLCFIVASSRQVAQFTLPASLTGVRGRLYGAAGLGAGGQHQGVLRYFESSDPPLINHRLFLEVLLQLFDSDGTSSSA